MGDQNNPGTIEASQPSVHEWDIENQRVAPVLEKYSFVIDNAKQLKENVMAVNQLDAQILDKELHEILKIQFNRIFMFFQEERIEQFGPELELILQLIIFRMSIWKCGYTAGQQLQNLKYRDLGKLKKILFMFLSLGIPYLLKRWWNIYAFFKKDVGDTPPGHITSRLHRLEKFYQLVSVVNFLVFLFNGKYVSPIHRLLNMDQTSIATQMVKRVSFEYLNRQLIWNGFTEFMLFIVPMIPISTLSKKIGVVTDKLMTKIGFKQNVVSETSENRAICPICKAKPTIPYRSNCNHVFCYYCIKSLILEEAKPNCPVCNSQITSVCRDHGQSEM